MIAAVGAFVLSAGMVTQATGGRLAAGDPDRRFESVSIDSRTIAARALFVALKGERFDGEAFVAEAARRGAAGLLVPTLPAETTDAAIIVVPDTLRALQDLGREARRRSGARVVAITGSAGKTTTKEITAELLSDRFRVFRNPGNLNNHIGLPLSLVELRNGQEVAVVELGMNHAGEIRTLIDIAQPEMRVWINVGDAHIGYFGSREALAQAKAEILESPATDTVVVANADDAMVMAHVATFSNRVLTFGERARADIQASHVVDRGFDGTAADVNTPAGALKVTVALPGRAQLMNVLAAIAVAVDFGVPLSSIESRVAAIRPVRRRGASTTLASGARVIDDSYNASPAAMRAMLGALGLTPTTGRRVAVLGEMLELGDQAAALHESVGRAVADARVNEVVVIGGPAADALAEGAAAGGVPRSGIHRFADSAAAATFVAGLVAPNDLVLIKGSRGTRTDVVADRLLEVA